MRVSKTIRVLDGALRGAVYDLSAGRCWPASAAEMTILRTLAFGRNPLTDTKTLIRMRQRNWIEPGAPVRRDLGITVPPADPRPDKFAQVWLEVTNSCNLKCRHCYAHSGPAADRSNELSLEEWRTLVDQLIDHGVRTLTFIGGEPTIRIDLVDALASHARTRSPDIRLTMTSNLAIARVTETTLDVVQRRHIEFHTTIYGMDPAAHDRMTLQKGSWAVTMDAIDRCLARAIPIHVTLFLDKPDAGVIAAHEAWLRLRGIARFSIRTPIRAGRAESQAWAVPGKINRLPGVFEFSEHFWQTAKSGHNCYQDHLTVKPDGSCAPCIMTRDVTYGNIAEVGLDSILASDNFRRFAALSKDQITGCRDCEFRYACFDCRPAAMAGGKELHRKPDCGYDPRSELGTQLEQSV